MQLETLHGGFSRGEHIAVLKIEKSLIELSVEGKLYSFWATRHHRPGKCAIRVPTFTLWK